MNNPISNNLISIKEIVVTNLITKITIDPGGFTEKFYRIFNNINFMQSFPDNKRWKSSSQIF